MSLDPVKLKAIDAELARIDIVLAERLFTQSDLREVIVQVRALVKIVESVRLALVWTRDSAVLKGDQ
jgi:hypothetical protein